MAQNVVAHLPQRVRAEDNFKSATIRLTNAIPVETSARLRKLSFTSFEHDHNPNLEAKAGELGTILENLIQARKDASGDKRKFEDVILGWFRASYPFATLFLNIAKTGSEVHFPRDQVYLDKRYLF